MENQNKIMKYIIGILCVLVLILGGYILYDKILSNKNTSTDKSVNNITENENSSETSSEQIKEKETNNQSENNLNTQELSVRTYRFFGYVVNSGPDMYTTLKLYSNNKYDLYVNNCEGTDKYSGNYTETNSNISLTGNKNIVFEKKNDGKSLEFNFSELGACNDSGGSFNLESAMLENN